MMGLPMTVLVVDIEKRETHIAALENTVQYAIATERCDRLEEKVG